MTKGFVDAQWEFPLGRAVQQKSCEGRWHHKGMPHAVELIEGNMIHGPGGRMRLLKDISGDRITVIDQGKEFVGKRTHDQIVWDDGAVWVRLPPVTTFDGHWAHKLHPEMVATVMGTKLQMADGTVTTLVPHGVDGFYILLNGEQHHAQIRGNFLYWSGGDVWIHVQSMRSEFDGRWQHKINPETVELIHRGLIHRPDGTISKIMPQGANKFTVELAGQVLEAELMDGEISWSDGTAWLAVKASEPLNGKWSYNRDPTIVLEICGDVVKKPDGSTVKILEQTESRLFIVHAGKRLQANLHNNDLLWQDGAVWSRLEVPQPECLLPDLEGEAEVAVDGDHCDSGQEKEKEEGAQATDLLGMQEAKPSDEDFDPLKGMAEKAAPNLAEVFTASPEVETNA